MTELMQKKRYESCENPDQHFAWLTVRGDDQRDDPEPDLHADPNPEEVEAPCPAIGCREIEVRAHVAFRTAASSISRRPSAMLGSSLHEPDQPVFQSGNRARLRGPARTPGRGDSPAVVEVLRGARRGVLPLHKIGVLAGPIHC